MSSLHLKQAAFFSIHRLEEWPMLDGLHKAGQDIINIFLSIQGNLTIIAKDHRLSIPGNSLYCNKYDHPCQLRVEEGTKGYLIRFGKDLLYSSDHQFYTPCFPDFLSLLIRAEILSVQPAFLESAIKIGEIMCQEYCHQHEESRQIIVGLLSILLLHITRTWKRTAPKKELAPRHALLHKFNILLEEKFKTNKKVADYAALLFVTSNYLNDIIKQATGNSVSFHIRQRVALEAVRQAKLTGASMKEVAWNLGFNDNAHFSKFFKKVAGANFSDMRKVAN